MRLGKRQLNCLAGIGLPGSAYVVPSTITRALVKKGLAKSLHPDGAFTFITSAGLRQLADEVDAGRLDLEPNLPKKGNKK